jgi:hypothetical protein
MAPGWSWADSVKPVAGTESCRHRHIGVVQSGLIQPGHRAEIVGDEQFVGFEFQPLAAEEYPR